MKIVKLLKFFKKRPFQLPVTSYLLPVLPKRMDKNKDAGKASGILI